MKLLILAVPVALSLAGCATQSDTAMTTGAAAGAALGAALTQGDGRDRTKGAVLGAAAGAAVAGLGNSAAQGPQCRFTYPDGRTFVAPCNS